jgi:hypothetical protein
VGITHVNPLQSNHVGKNCPRYDLGGANVIEFMHVPVSLAINNEKNQQTNHEKLLPSDPCHLRDKNHIKRQFAARYGP